MAIARNNNLSKSAKFFDSDGALNLVEGSNITITKNANAGTITIASTASGGGGSGTVDSAFVTGLPVSTFTNDVQYLDSTTVQGVIDATYIQANQTTYNTADFPDSAGVIALISANETTYTNVSEFINDANYLDSTTVQGVIDQTYVRNNQITYNTSDFVDSAYVTTQINNLIGSAPGTLDTLEEIANALNNDSDAYGSLVALINGMADSDWVQSLPVSTFTNDANYLDSTTVQGVVNSAYVQAQQITYNTSNFTDSAFVTGLPVSTFTNDANYLDSVTAQAVVQGIVDSAYINARVDAVAAGTDSATVVSIIGETVDSAYIALRETPQDFAYSSLTGAPTTVSTFTNDANYLDSTTVQGVIDGTYIQANQITYSTLDFPDSAGVTTLANAAISSAIGSSVLAYDANLQGFVDTFTLPTTDGATNHVLLTNGSGTLSFASVASVSGATDSGDVRNLIDEVVDSAFVALHQVPQDFAYSSLTGAPTNVSSFTNDANYLDSTTVQSVIDATYIQNNQITYNTSDFLDSTTVYPLFSAGTGVTYNGSGQFSIGQSVGTSDDVTFADITVDNLTVNGTTTTVNSVTYTIVDPLFHLADSNETSDVVDIGFVGHYSDDGGSTKRHTGFFRDASNGQYYVFNGLVDADLDSSLPVNIIDRSGTDFELAAFNAGSLAGKYLGFDSDFNVKAPLTNVSTFINNANYLDSTTVQGVIDATYIQANQTTYDFLDSAEAIALIDSDHVQLRQDYAYASLTGAPTNVSSFVNDANYLDSTTVTGVIDAAYINARVDAVDAGTDSATVVTIINETVDSAYVQLRVPATYIQANQTTYSTADFLDSTYALALLANNTINVGGLTVNSAYTLPTADGSSNNVLSTNGSGTLSFVSVASISGTVDSGDVRSIIDSDYVQARQIPPNNVDLTNYHYVATAGQTSFSGSDIAGNSLTYTTSNIQVFKNGVLLIDSDDYTATSGNSIVLSSGARVGDTISVSNYGQSAGSLNLRDSADGIAVTASLSVEGAMYVNGSVETLIDKSSATGTVTHDFSQGALFYHSSISGNFAVNLTNFPTTNGKAIVVSLILDQGATAYIPNALQVGGVAQTINWFGGSAPAGNANKKDLVAFTLIRRSGSWTVLGQLSSYG